ncbi:MAG: hypothetical protein ACLFUU_13315, partial [Desulfobacteraceae bacterium]
MEGPIQSILQNKHVVILPDNDDPGRQHAQNVARNLHGVAATIKIVNLPGLPEKGDVRDWLANSGMVEALEKLAQAIEEWEPSPKEPQPLTSAGLYRITGGVTCYEKNTRDGLMTVPLCNFTAQIISEELRDDGAERQTVFAIEGKLQAGRPLPKVEVPAQQANQAQSPPPVPPKGGS